MEDFDTYTKVENDGCTFTVTANYKVQSNGLTRTTNNSYIYKDYGIAYLSGDFEHWFEFYGIDVVLTGGLYNRCIFAAFWNALGDYPAIRNSSQGAGVYYDGETGGPHLKIFTRDGAGGGQVGASVAISGTTLYYCIFKRVGTTYTLEVYSDAARTVLVGSSTITETAYNLRYAYGIQSIDLAGAYDADIYIQNWNLTGLTDASKNLQAAFVIPVSDFAEFAAEFMVNQFSDSIDLTAEFVTQQLSEDLLSEFIIRHNPSINFKAIFDINQFNATLDAWGIIRIIQQYDISGAKGIGFYWWGAGALDHLTEFEMHSPTGFWRAYFPDGPANWHYVFIPISNFTELGIDGSRPDATDVTAFLWTYHTTGTRKVLDLTIWYVEPPDLKGIFIVRQTRTKDLYAKLEVTHSVDLYAKFEAQAVQNLYAKFEVAQWEDLYAKFESQATADLKGVFVVRQP